MLVYAYERGGATTAGLVAVAQLVPAGLFAPFALGARRPAPPGRVLALGYVAQALAMGATAAALLARGAAARRLRARGGGGDGGDDHPADAGGARAGARPHAGRADRDQRRLRLDRERQRARRAGADRRPARRRLAGLGLRRDGRRGRAVGAARRAACTARRRRATRCRRYEEALAGFRVLAREPSARVLVGLLGGQFVAIGALDVLYVVLAISVLDLGGSGAGYLNAAFGAGGVAGIAVTVALVGRAPPRCRRSCSACSSGARRSSCSRAWPTVGGALVLLAVAGAGAVAARRRRPDDPAANRADRRALTRLRRARRALDGRPRARLAAHAALVALAGARWAIAGIGALLPLAVLLSARHAGARSTAARRCRWSRSRCCARCRSSRRSARRSWKVSRTGSRSGACRPGPRSSARASPATASTSSPTASWTWKPTAASCGQLHRGDGFGEIALLRDVPRTATVTARTDAACTRSARPTFLASVGAHPRAASEADRLVHERLPSPQATIAP